MPKPNEACTQREIVVERFRFVKVYARKKQVSSNLKKVLLTDLRGQTHEKREVSMMFSTLKSRKLLRPSIRGFEENQQPDGDDH